VDVVFSRNLILRFHDPRRFGCMLWLPGDPMTHVLLSSLGPEPLSEDFDADYLFRQSRKRTAPIKTFIMDSHVVVGVGNIYANEALFMAGISPHKKAGMVSQARMELLVNAIKSILARAIEVGGTTLRDFVGGDGKPGYFAQSLLVYGRAGKSCITCRSVLKESRLGQRSTVFCPLCQK
jgi:formamidopyrimidine-DNA glycosylase